jgi:hypothetical protein
MASTLRLVLPPFAAGKLAALLVPMLTVLSSTNEPGRPTYADLMRPFGSWDGESYRSIAEHGYPSGPLDLDLGHPGHLWAFLPGYPMLIRATMLLIPDSTTAGVIVSSVCELVALVFLAKLVLHERAGDVESARFSAWLLVVYPYAVFLTAAYTESPFLAAATASLYFMRRGDNLRACALAALAVAVRVTGLALVPALLFEYLWRRRFRPGFGVLAIALPAVPLLLFAWYAHSTTGDGLAYWHVQQSSSFNRVTAWPWDGLRATFNTAGATGNSFIFSMEFLFGVLGFIAVLLLARRRDIAPSLTVYAAALWVMSTSFAYWLSVPRYMMTMVPIYLLGAVLTQGRPQLRIALLVVSAAWMAFIATLLGTGRFVA